MTEQKEAIVINTCVRVYKRLISKRSTIETRLSLFNFSALYGKAEIVNTTKDLLYIELFEYNNTIQMYETILECSGLLDIVKKLAS